MQNHNTPLRPWQQTSLQVTVLTVLTILLIVGHARENIVVFGVFAAGLFAWSLSLSYLLRRARKRYHELVRSQNSFLSIVGEEIRSPLSGVLGTTDLLASTDMDTESRQHISTIRRCGAQLLVIVDDILDYSRMERASLELEQKPFDIRAAFAQTIDIVQIEADQKGLDLKCDLSNAFPQFVVGDRQRFEQILFNLLANAVKFTSSGRVSVSASSEDLEACQVKLTIKVTDTGPGIPKERRKRVFQPFTQCEDASGGTGIGLTICAQLVQKMGGTIGFDTELGRGTSFTFTAVLGKATHEAKELDTQSLFAQRLPAKILVAEDDPVNRKTICSLLRKLGYEPDSVENGREALEAVRQRGYDVVLMDVQMPEMDGIEATRRILIEAENEEHPIIIPMTATTFSDECAYCRRLGIVDYIKKPVTLHGLREVLQHCLQEGKVRYQVAHDAGLYRDFELHPQSPSPAWYTRPAVDAELLFRAHQGSQSVAKETLPLFLIDARNDIARMREALASADIETLHIRAKRMREACLLMGAEPLAEYCRQLELTQTHDPHFISLMVDQLEIQLDNAKRALEDILA